MRPVSIYCRDFLSYAELDLDLTEVNTAAVVGKNGAGKSSLAIDLMTFALWGESRAPSIAKNIRDGADEAMVRLVFQANGVRYTVTRNLYLNGRGNTVSLTRDDGEDEVNAGRHTVADTQKAIDALVGLDFDAVVAGPVMIQNDSNNLMGRRPGDAKDLLIRLFGVDKYEEPHAEAKSRASSYSRNAADYAKQLDEIETIAAEEPQVRLDLASAVLDHEKAKHERSAAEQQVVSLRERQAAMQEKARHADTLRQTVEQLTSRIRSDKDEYDRLLRAISAAHVTKDEAEPSFPPLTVVDEDTIDSVTQQWRAISEAANQRSAILAQLQPLSKELIDLRERHAIVETVPCHAEGIYATCRFLTSAPTVEQIEEVRAKGAALKEEATGLYDTAAADEAYKMVVKASNDRAAYEREKGRRDTALAQWRLKVDNATQMANTGKSSLERMSTQIERDQERLRRAKEQLGETDVEQNAVHEIEMSLRALNDSIDEMKKSISMLYEPAVRRSEDAAKRIEEAKSRRPLLEQQCREEQSKAETYGILAKAFHRDGIPTLILENGIPLIEDRANEILDRMPDNYRVRLRTQREKKGGMVDKLNIVVEVSGKERDYGLLSGGERFRIDFALRIALARVLANRAGSSFDTLIIDEGFGSQDDDGIEAMLESLAAVQEEFQMVLVVTHQKPVIERFTSRIEVSRDEEGSHAVLVT